MADHGSCHHLLGTSYIECLQQRQLESSAGGRNAYQKTAFHCDSESRACLLTVPSSVSTQDSGSRAFLAKKM